jgi:hypothetical protein
MASVKRRDDRTSGVIPGRFELPRRTSTVRMRSCLTAYRPVVVGSFSGNVRQRHRPLPDERLSSNGRRGAGSRTGARSCLRPAYSARCSTCRTDRAVQRCIHRRGAHTSLLMRPLADPSRMRRRRQGADVSPLRRNLRFRGARRQARPQSRLNGVQPPQQGQ